jgi:hypothetical protein
MTTAVVQPVGRLVGRMSAVVTDAINAAARHGATRNGDQSVPGLGIAVTDPPARHGEVRGQVAHRAARTGDRLAHHAALGQEPERQVTGHDE